MKIENEKTAAFALRFILSAPVLLALWWYVLPIYAYGLGFISLSLLRYVLCLPVDGFHVEAAGVLNTKTILRIASNSHSYPFAIGYLTTNMAPFWSLLLSSSKKSMRKKIFYLLFGSGILALSHVGYLTFAFRFREVITIYPDIPYVVAQLLLILPFPLWIIFILKEANREKVSFS